MINKYYFNELEVKNTFAQEVQEIFSREEIITEIENQILQVHSVEQPDYTSFPCTIIQVINATTNSKYSTSFEIEHITNFVAEFTLYSQDTPNLHKDDAVIILSQILIRELRRKYNLLVVTQNQTLPNVNVNFTRRIVRFSGVFDNVTNSIYSD